MSAKTKGSQKFLKLNILVSSFSKNYKKFEKKFSRFFLNFVRTSDTLGKRADNNDLDIGYVFDFDVDFCNLSIEMGSTFSSS